MRRGHLWSTMSCHEVPQRRCEKLGGCAQKAHHKFTHRKCWAFFYSEGMKTHPQQNTLPFNNPDGLKSAGKQNQWLLKQKSAEKIAKKVMRQLLAAELSIQLKAPLCLMSACSQKCNVMQWNVNESRDNQSNWAASLKNHECLYQI